MLQTKIFNPITLLACMFFCGVAIGYIVGIERMNDKLQSERAIQIREMVQIHESYKQSLNTMTYRIDSIVERIEGTK